MQHPSKDAIYCLSYQRSGSSWFRYCFAFITETEIDKDLLFHSHSIKNDLWTLENTFDVKNILLLRNYKECIFSETKNLYETAPSEPLISLYNYIAQHDPIAHRWWHSSASGEGTQHQATIRAIDMLLNFDAEQYVSDFLLPNLPVSADNGVVAKYVAFSFVHHFHFALQLKRYYKLLEYHDKLSKISPNNTLVVKYEDFMEDPLAELSNVIDFIEASHLVASEYIDKFRDNLRKLIDNMEYHKRSSIASYRAEGYLALSYKKDDKYNYHSSKHSKQFLIEIDNVLKNKNLELYNQYLSGYEEKGD